jgi:hypothetical protein
MGFEPFNGHNAIQLEKYLISIRISHNRNIKYCKSLGQSNKKILLLLDMKICQYKNEKSNLNIFYILYRKHVLS